MMEICGHVDILVNNGGVSHRGTVIETSPDVDMKIMSVNYFGSVALIKGKINQTIVLINKCINVMCNDHNFS